MGKGRQRRGPQRLGPGRDGEGRAATLPPPGAIAGVANYSAGLGRAGLRGAAASRGTDRSDRVTESRGAGGGAATRQERTAGPFLASKEGRVSRPRGAPCPARASGWPTLGGPQQDALVAWLSDLSRASPCGW